MQSNKSNTVLLVEDDPMTRSIFRMILGRTGLNVIEAVDGIDALEKVELHKPNVVMLDVTMPRMNGFEVCEKLRSQPHTAHLPVVFVTTHMDEKSVERGMAFGNAHYLLKPVAFKDLLAVLKKVIGQLDATTVSGPVLSENAPDSVAYGAC
ncbi:MAG: response regulator [Chloroflexota bacterium]